LLATLKKQTSINVKSNKNSKYYPSKSPQVSRAQIKSKATGDERMEKMSERPHCFTCLHHHSFFPVGRLFVCPIEKKGEISFFPRTP
jgi:hypothetical protein